VDKIIKSIVMVFITKRRIFWADSATEVAMDVYLLCTILDDCLLSSNIGLVTCCLVLISSPLSSQFSLSKIVCTISNCHLYMRIFGCIHLFMCHHKEPKNLHMGNTS